MKNMEEIKARINELKEMDADMVIRHARASKGSYLEKVWYEEHTKILREISALKWVLGDEET